MAGLSLRIRSFLFLGTGFLALAVVAMIWNAAVNLHWTWLWYVAGIVLGLMILTTFAVFREEARGDARDGRGAAGVGVSGRKAGTGFYGFAGPPPSHPDRALLGGSGTRHAISRPQIPRGGATSG